MGAPRARSARGVRQIKPAPQNAHRLVVVGWKGEEDRRRMLEDGWHASHLCHNPTCANPDHIVVEAKARNEGRKRCKALGPVVLVTIEGREYRLPPNGTCECPGEKCIFMVERRTAFPL